MTAPVIVATISALDRLRRSNVADEHRHSARRCDLSLLEGTPGVEMRDGMVAVDERLMTGRSGVFAGGDAVPAERTVATAVGHGRQAAEHIHDWLRGRAVQTSVATGDPVGLDALNPWYYADAPRQLRPRLEAARRRSGFDEVVAGLDTESALFEARRCLSCGTCLGCDNCFGMCPDDAVIKIGEGGPGAYAIDLEHCKGCGICAAECPCGAIEMEPEEI